MPVTQQFAYGSVNPIIALVMALVGAQFGLICAARVRQSANRRLRVFWLLIAGVALGGVGGWLTHQMAMLGFDVPASPIRYDVDKVLLGALIAMVGAAVALLLVGNARPARFRIVLGGLLLAGAMTAMLYVGIAAIHVNGRHTYDVRLVVTSLVIAVIGSIAALWLTVSENRHGAVTGGIVFALMIVATHYTAMAALHLRLSPQPHQPAGVQPDILIVPTIIVAILALLGMLFAGLHLIADDELASTIDNAVARGAAGADGPLQVEWELVPPAPAEVFDPTSLRSYERAYSDSVIRGDRDQTS